MNRAEWILILWLDEPLKLTEHFLQSATQMSPDAFTPLEHIISLFLKVFVSKFQPVQSTACYAKAPRVAFQHQEKQGLIGKEPRCARVKWYVYFHRLLDT